MNWQERPAVRKGTLGERIFDQWLLSKQAVPYLPMQGAAHPFDRLVATANKRSIFVAEVKAKPRRNNYPDTGIDLRHYADYCRIRDKHRLRVFIAFVDERLGKIYGEFLDVLERSRRIDGRLYPSRHKGIIYFPLVAMRDIAPLDSEQISALSELRRSNHDAGGPTAFINGVPWP